MEIKIPIVIDDKALEEAIDKRVAELKQEGDFVLVTRCKDCLYFVKTKVSGYGLCSAMTNPNYVKEEHFCSYAEQKEIEGE